MSKKSQTTKKSANHYREASHDMSKLAEKSPYSRAVCLIERLFDGHVLESAALAQMGLAPRDRTFAEPALYQIQVGKALQGARKIGAELAVRGEEGQSLIGGLLATHVALFFGTAPVDKVEEMSSYATVQAKQWYLIRTVEGMRVETALPGGAKELLFTAELFDRLVSGDARWDDATNAKLNEIVKAHRLSPRQVQLVEALMAIGVAAYDNADSLAMAFYERFESQQPESMLTSDDPNMPTFTELRAMVRRHVTREFQLVGLYADAAMFPTDKAIAERQVAALETARHESIYLARVAAAQILKVVMKKMMGRGGKEEEREEEKERKREEKEELRHEKKLEQDLEAEEEGGGEPYDLVESDARGRRNPGHRANGEFKSGARDARGRFTSKGRDARGRYTKSRGEYDDYILESDTRHGKSGRFVSGTRHGKSGRFVSGTRHGKNGRYVSSRNRVSVHEIIPGDDADLEDYTSLKLLGERARELESKPASSNEAERLELYQRLADVAARRKARKLTYVRERLRDLARRASPADDEEREELHFIETKLMKSRDYDGKTLRSACNPSRGKFVLIEEIAEEEPRLYTEEEEEEAEYSSEPLLDTEDLGSEEEEEEEMRVARLLEESRARGKTRNSSTRGSSDGELRQAEDYEHFLAAERKPGESTERALERFVREGSIDVPESYVLGLLAKLEEHRRRIKALHAKQDDTSYGAPRTKYLPSMGGAKKGKGAKAIF